MSAVDAVIDRWVAKQQQTQQAPVTNPGSSLDQIISRSLAKQQDTGQNTHPLDDTAVSQAQQAIGDQSYNGLCEKFAEQQVYGKTGLYPTAIDAWNDYKEQQMTHDDITQAPAGSLIYWNADNSNAGEGHVSISDGQGNMIAPTSRGVEQMPIADWIQTTGQQPLGYVQP